MADGPTDPPPDDGGNPEDGPILSPDELELEEDEHVTKIDEGRFVVSPDGSQDRDVGPAESGGAESEPTAESGDREPSNERPPPETPTTTPERADRTRSGAATTTTPTEREVHDWLERDLEGTRSRYAFDVTAKFDDTVTQRRLASNDVVTVFESLVLWYSQGLDRDTPVEEVLGILLMESNLPIRFPAVSIQRLVQSTDLDPDDSIGDLVEAVEAQDGFRL
jgi:hypothetical protein